MRSRRGLLSGTDQFEAIKQNNGVPFDNSLRLVNSLQGAFEGAPVHAFWLRHVFANSAIVAEPSAQGEGSGQSTIARRFSLRSIRQPIGASTREDGGPGRKMQPRRALAGARANEPPASTAERLGAGRQRNVVFALAFLAAPAVGGRPMRAMVRMIHIIAREHRHTVAF